MPRGLPLVADFVECLTATTSHPGNIVRLLGKKATDGKGIMDRTITGQAGGPMKQAEPVLSARNADVEKVRELH